MIKKILSRIENSPISFWQIALLFYAAVFFRIFLENYANSDNQGLMSNLTDIFFHYPLWFLSVFLFSLAILALVTGERIEKIARLSAVFSFIMLLPPVLDIIVSGGAGVRYIFITGSVPELARSFLTFLGGGAVGGGIRTEAALALIFAGYYIFYKTKNIRKAVLGAFSLYLIIFAFMIFPTILFWAQNTISENPQKITIETTENFYYSQEPANTITDYRTFILDRNNFKSPQFRVVEKIYSITLSVFFLSTAILALGLCFFLYSKRKFIAMLKNFRWRRITHYFLMAFLGVYLGSSFAERIPVGSLFDFFSFLSLFGAILFAWLFSVWENDEVDMEGDKISSPDRPLGKGLFSVGEWRSMKFLFLFLSLNFAFLSGFYPFIFILLFLAVYHLYSAPPLRLKRFPGISSLLIAVNTVIAVLAGFFISSGTENLRIFPPKYALGLLAMVFLGENIKNLKDIEGDKKEGIKTLPVLLGEKRGKLAVGILVFLSAVLIPFVFYLSALTAAVSIIFGAVLFLLVNRKNFKEKYVFLAYFIFIPAFILAILFSNQAAGAGKLERESAAAEKGGRWIYGYEGDFPDPGVLFIAKTINDDYCSSSPKMEEFWKEKIKKFGKHPYLAVFERLFAGGDYEMSGRTAGILRTPQKIYNDVLPQALYCDLVPVRSDFAENTFEGLEKETGYDLTHKFWAAVLFKKNGCSAKGYDVDEVISAAAERMADRQESRKGKFDDLYAERTAMLLHYGFADLVKEEWIENILKNQKPSGAWATPGLFLNETENPHTTVLSVWALSQYSQTCPFNF